ncbi:ATP-binding cassette domain-containing protein [Streptomyces marincola]|uniref:ATP-binding cassette domain-containing protein n=1 Tax=Streptomyces marincola TaxID=2878388 RepID=UPI001CF4F12C|nr:ATP-binding cassette domain-containing protein [Streptomyces marincola]UCM89369.1 ATP-binding cassette domain-containing protein [Streptomyces marincola]
MDPTPASEADAAIVTRGLVKTFGGHRAVDGIDLTVPAGSVYGVLGPNGAGKTTTVRMLATLLRPDGGQARVFGRDVVEDPDGVRSLVSLTGQYASVDEDLTGVENLVLLGRLLGFGKAEARRRAELLLDAFGLSEAAGRQAKTYSGGMRRRLDIAASMVNRARLLFLDEPTTGLDPRSRAQVWEVVRMLTHSGTTVLLTTQYLEEADQLASRVAVIDRGSVVAEGTPAALKSRLGAGTVRLRLRNAGQRLEAEYTLRRALEVAVQPGNEPGTLYALLNADDLVGDRANDRVAHSLSELARAGIGVSEFSLGQPSLDEVFLALTDGAGANSSALAQHTDRTREGDR